MAQVFIVNTVDGKSIADEIQAALARKNARIRVLSISQKMRGINPQPLQQAIAASDSIILLFTPGATASNAREFESTFSYAVQQEKTIYPVQIDGTPLPNYINIHSFSITTGNQAGIDDLVNDILRDPPFAWWRKLPLYAKASLGVLAVILGLLFAFFALFDNEDRRLFFCGVTNNMLPSCQITPTGTQIGFPPSNTPSATYTPTPTVTLTSTPQPPTPTPTSIPCGQLLLAENFDDASLPQNWVADAGKWATVLDGSNAVYLHTSTTPDYGMVAIGDPNWRDYSLEFNIKVDDFASARLAIIDLRLSPSGNEKITLVLDFMSKDLVLSETYKSDGIAQKVRSRNWFFQENNWRKIRIEVQDQETRIYFDDTYILRANINPKVRTGVARFQSSTPYIMFDNVRVSSLDNC